MSVVNLEEFKLKRLAIFTTPAEDPVKTEDLAATLDGPSLPALSPGAPPGAEDGDARLQMAILGLHKATLDQHVQVKKFHRVTLDLADKISKLEQSCIRFDRNVRRIRLKPLSRAARTLSRTMDSYLATT